MWLSRRRLGSRRLHGTSTHLDQPVFEDTGFWFRHWVALLFATYAGRPVGAPVPPVARRADGDHRHRLACHIHSHGRFAQVIGDLPGGIFRHTTPRSCPPTFLLGACSWTPGRALLAVLRLPPSSTTSSPEAERLQKGENLCYRSEGCQDACAFLLPLAARRLRRGLRCRLVLLSLWLRLELWC